MVFSKLMENDTENNFFEINGATPAKVTWKGPGGGPSSFYTTWSFWAIIGALGLSILCLPIVHLKKMKRSTKHGLAAFIIVILIGFCANSVGVGLASQLLMKKGFQDVSTLGNQPISIRGSWVEGVIGLNAKVHLLPIVFVFIGIFILSTLPFTGNKIHIFLLSMLLPIAMFLAWLVTPVPIENSDSKTTPLNKINIVYNNPGWIMSLFPIGLFASGLIFVSLLQKKKKGNK